MKYLVILGDGMSDLAVPELGNKTPLEVAHKPTIDYLASKSIVGFVKTVPDNMQPGSDVANLSVLGYDPLKYYSGRSPLEAISIGVDSDDSDMAIRCNLITLSTNSSFDEATLEDYSADEISSQEAEILIRYISQKLNTDKIKFFSGVSYRHCMLWKNCNYDFKLIPPHDITEKKISNYLPVGEKSEVLYDLMKKSFEILKNHPINKKRVSDGLRPANSIWLWGQGKKSQLPSFYNKYKLNGSVISAVDLIKGIGISAKLKSVDVPGATGTIHTNFEGKILATLNEFDSGQDFVYLHIEAPDECGHRNEVHNKVRSIELIDQKVVFPLLNALDKFENFKILILPDHPTPLSLRTHTSDPVPFLMFEKKHHHLSGVKIYDENQNSNLFISDGYKLMDIFLKE